MKDNEFDQLVKATMQNGTEEVPAGMWAAVQSQLSSVAPATSKKVIAPWIWSAGVALAAAAAVTVAVVFGGREDGTDRIEIIQSETASLADVPSTELTAPADELGSTYAAADEKTSEGNNSENKTQTTAVTVPSSVTYAQEVCDTPAETSSDEEEPAVETRDTDNNATTTNQRPARSETDGNESVKQEEKTWSDPFAEMDRKEKATSRKKTGVAITAFGNAASNTGKSGNGSAGVMKVSAAVPTATSITETGESSYMIPISAGVGLKINFAERFGIGVGVNASFLSRTYAGTYREVDENGLITRSDSFSNIRNQQYYIGVPLNLYCSIISNKHVDFYAYAGGSVNKCLSSTHKASEAGISEINYKDDIKFLSRNGFCYSVGGGFGVEFLMGNHFGFYLDPSLSYRFKGSAPTSIWTKQPLMFGVEAGFRVRL